MPPLARSPLLVVARLAAAAFTLALLQTISCAAGEDSSCERNSDCDRGYCSDGKCKRDCVDGNLDCPKGYVCSAIGRCEFNGPFAGASGQGGEGGAGQGAGTTGQSGAGSGATSGASGAGSAGKAGGPQGGAGSGGAGQAGAGQGGAGGPLAGAGGSQGGAGAGQGGEAQGGAPQGGAGVGGAGTGVGGEPFGGGGMTVAAELDPCAADGDCAPGLLCKSQHKGGPKACARACSSGQDCYGGRRCEQIDGSFACVQGDIGRPCGVADECNFACLLSQKYCTSTCSTGADCPNGYACQGVGTPPQSVCVKLEADCSENTSACIAPAACDNSPSLVVASCTAACSSAADCPQRAQGLPPWTCDGLCRRPKDVFGPLPGGSTPTQYACGPGGAVVNMCNDGQHINFDAFDIPAPPQVNCSNPITTDGKAGDACINSCRYEGGCSWGFTCTAIGNINNARIGLCLLNGLAPVGAPCTSGTQCEFGYCVAGKCSRDCTTDKLCPTGSTCTAAGGPPAQGMPFHRCQ